MRQNEEEKIKKQKERTEEIRYGDLYHFSEDVKNG